MSLFIEKEPNDLLLAQLLRIKSVYVYFDDIRKQLGPNNGTVTTAGPSDATVYIENPDALTPEQLMAARYWVARKIGLPDSPDKISIESAE